VRPTREMTAAVRRALDEQWPHVQQAARVQCAIIATHIECGTDDAPSRVAARFAAHKLNGSLGTFGRHDASKVAAAIEARLTAGAVDVSEPDLAGLLAHLEVLIG